MNDDTEEPQTERAGTPIHWAREDMQGLAQTLAVLYLEVESPLDLVAHRALVESRKVQEHLNKVNVDYER